MAKESFYDTDQQDNEQWYNREQAKIAQWLKKLRFQRKIFGGVSEQDVWKKMSVLNTMYESALAAERVRYDALIEIYKKESVSANVDYDSSAFGSSTGSVIGDEGHIHSCSKGKIGNE